MGIVAGLSNEKSMLLETDLFSYYVNWGELRRLATFHGFLYHRTQYIPLVSYCCNKVYKIICLGQWDYFCIYN